MQSVLRRQKDTFWYTAFMVKRFQHKKPSSFAVEFEREEDGRWIVEIPALPGVLAYGVTKQEALRKVYAIALRTF